jgi:CRP-like cAMP-binding protein
MLTLQTENHLLSALPDNDYRRIFPHLTPQRFRRGLIIHRRDEPLQHVFFPAESVIWLTCTTEAGASSQLAMVGSEGIVGIEVFYGSRSALCDATVHPSHDAVGHRMTVDVFRGELDRRGAFYDAVLHYAGALVDSLAQAVACNARHSAEARCSRWLLEVQLRFQNADVLSATHELLADLLGLRRPTVSLILQNLQSQGIISTNRGRIRIQDQFALQQRACECVKKSAAVCAASDPRAESAAI